MAHSYHELRELSREALVREYDRVAPSTVFGLSFLRDEVARRDFEEQNAQLVAMTRHIRLMTAVITVLTMVNVVAVVMVLTRP